MRTIRIYFMIIVVLLVMGLTVAYASEAEDIKENAVDALTFCFTTIEENPEAFSINEVYNLDCTQYIFVVTGGDDSFDLVAMYVYREEDIKKWSLTYSAFKSSMLSQTEALQAVLEDNNLKLQEFTKWNAEDIEWIKNQILNGGNNSISAINSPVGSDSTEMKVLQKGSKGDDVIKLQNRLNDLGYSVGTADGDFGNKTKSAIEAFQKDNGLDVTGIADLETQELLFSDKVANKANKEADKLQAITKGIDYITDYALEYLPTIFSAFGSTSSCKIIEVYCEEKGDDIYELTAKGRSGANSIGIGLNLKIIKDQNGKWNISETSSPHMYMGGSENNLPGKLVWSTDDKGYDALMDAFRELGKAVDANGDGQISYDEIFKTK